MHPAQVQVDPGSRLACRISVCHPCFIEKAEAFAIAQVQVCPEKDCSRKGVGHIMVVLHLKTQVVAQRQVDIIQFRIRTGIGKPSAYTYIIADRITH